MGSLWDILDKDSDAIAGNIIETLQNNNVEKDLAILLFETKKFDI